MKKKSVIQFKKKWLGGMFVCICLLGMLKGCASTSRKLGIKEMQGSYKEGTIISATQKTPVSFEELMADLSGRRIIYVGEKHSDRSHHAVQLKIIKAIYRHHQNMAVGMEMFDHTYQPVLDLWSAGKMDPREFLRKVHWYANWRYDFSLYSDILDFIKEKKIRLVALNIPFNIPPKIRVGGIENLADDEKKHLPRDIDTSNTAHREYVADVFKRHHFKGMVEFDDFYTAQSVWEDAMAESITRNLENDKMIVLAGNGHIQYKYGIPDRAFRRTGASFRTIYPARVGQEIDLGIADYIWVTN
jgi:uncharacterized iron-regulated protein